MYQEKVDVLVRNYYDFLQDLHRWLTKGYIVGYKFKVKQFEKRPEYLRVSGVLIAKKKEDLDKLFTHFFHFYP